jgi:hypothetical protein
LGKGPCGLQEKHAMLLMWLWYFALHNDHCVRSQPLILCGLWRLTYTAYTISRRGQVDHWHHQAIRREGTWRISVDSWTDSCCILGRPFLDRLYDLHGSDQILWSDQFCSIARARKSEQFRHSHPLIVYIVWGPDAGKAQLGSERSLTMFDLLSTFLNHCWWDEGEASNLAVRWCCQPRNALTMAKCKESPRLLG